MGELAIDMAPVLGVVGKALTGTLYFFVGLILMSWAIWWARAIYRVVRKR